MRIFVSLFFVTVAVAAASDNNKYCYLTSCWGRKHTMCNNNNKNQCEKLISNKLTENEKKSILSLHNSLRNNVKIGNETRGANGPQPAAKYMNNLKWDDEIANIAQRWADQCIFSHDECRNTETDYVGQNIAYSATTEDVKTIEMKDLVQMWYDEVDNFDGSRINQPYDGKSGKNGAVVGHYTQLVWADTHKIGCGIVKYKENIYNSVNLICNYSPGGNIINEKIYEIAD